LSASRSTMVLVASRRETDRVVPLHTAATLAQAVVVCLFHRATMRPCFSRMAYDCPVEECQSTFAFSAIDAIIETSTAKVEAKPSASDEREKPEAKLVKALFLCHDCGRSFEYVKMSAADAMTMFAYCADCVPPRDINRSSVKVSHEPNEDGVLDPFGHRGWINRTGV